MSFVGPRPERPFFVEQLTAQIPFYSQRHAVKPGITGWAQVKYRYGASVEDAMEKLRYDLYYIKNLSIGFDLTILVDTVKVMLFRQGGQVSRLEANAALEGGTALPAIARNVSTRYLVIAAEAGLGVLLLPFNLKHLGPETYGLWMVAASITAYFSILDLGYGGALVKFVAQYRARRDARAINEILSTLLLSLRRRGRRRLARGRRRSRSTSRRCSTLTAAQAATGRAVLLIVSAQRGGRLRLQRVRRRDQRLPALRPQQRRGPGEQRRRRPRQRGGPRCGLRAGRPGGGDDGRAARDLLRLPSQRVPRLPGALAVAVARRERRACER